MGSPSPLSSNAMEISPFIVAFMAVFVQSTVLPESRHSTQTPCPQSFQPGHRKDDGLPGKSWTSQSPRPDRGNTSRAGDMQKQEHRKKQKRWPSVRTETHGNCS